MKYNQLMKSLFSVTVQPLKYYQRYEFIIFTALLLLAVLNGQTTVFYIIYFFWWNELIRIVVDHFFAKRNKNVVVEKGTSPHFISDSFFLMGIYLVFIVVFFGFIANWSNQELTIMNVRILFFKNWFFNINIMLALLERIYMHQTKQPVEVHLGLFTPNMIVLHISIIVGAILMFFVVKKMPEIFTPDNFWGSVIIITPFLALKKIVQKITQPDTTVRQ